MLRILSTLSGCVIGCAALAHGDVATADHKPVPGDRPVRVIIIAGQSNAKGWNDYSECRGDNEKILDGLKSQPGVLYWSAARKAWGPLKIGETNGLTPKSFGPELGLCHNLAKLMPGERFAIFKFAVGATGIADSKDYTDYIPSLKAYDDKGGNWHPPAEGRGPGTHYKNMIAEAGKAMAALDKDGVKHELAACVWVQGEHEAGISPKMAADYKTLLQSLMRSIRNDLNKPDLPFAIGMVSGSWPYCDTVRAAQTAVAKEDAHVELIESIDITRAGSGGKAHYDANGMIEFGRRAAVATERLLNAQKAKQRQTKGGRPS